jgi:hypothetical protein
VGVLQEIRARLEREAIRERMHGLAARRRRRREARREHRIGERHAGQGRIAGLYTPAAARGHHEQRTPPHGAAYIPGGHRRAVAAHGNCSCRQAAHLLTVRRPK